MKREFKFGIKNVIYIMLALAAIIGFFEFYNLDEFTNCMTIASNKDYIEIDNNIYAKSGLSLSEIKELLDMLEVAKTRNKELFGEVRQEATIIFARNLIDAKKFRGNNVGVTHHSMAGLYVIIGPDGMNEDILSHEMAHSELAARLGWYKFNRLPIWFNEGVATQVDYSTGYSLKEWNVLTNKGDNVPEIKKLITAEEFYDLDQEKRIDNYILAQHELKKWLEVSGREGLNMLILRVKDGDDLAISYTDILIQFSRKMRE